MSCTSRCCSENIQNRISTMSETRRLSYPVTFHHAAKSAPKSLVLPPLALAPFCTTFEPYLRHPFPPLLGLNMKFGNGAPVTFSRSRIDFSVDSIITSDRNSTPSQVRFQNSFHQFVPIAAQPQQENEEKVPQLIKSRGRPSADSINLLKQKSMENPFRYKCSECTRSFPRKKSLDTHRLIHSNIKPYACDFPGCKRKFKQSGQLKTHVRLHTGEKPFECTFPLCTVSFTHANRKCPNHPDYPLRRISIQNRSKFFDTLVMTSDSENSNMQIKAWLEKHFRTKTKQDGDVLKSIENADNIGRSLSEKFCEKKCAPICDKNVLPVSEENDRRLLSAVALVELQNQMKSSKKENYEYLFSSMKKLS